MSECTAPVLTTTRRDATVDSIDARLTVWGQAARAAIPRRVDALVAAAVAASAELKIEEAARTPERGAEGLLLADIASLLPLVERALPDALCRARRLLWVDPERLEEELRAALEPACEAARQLVRKIQSRNRRRARLWAEDPARLNRLREEVEGLRLPKAPAAIPLQRAIAARLGLTQAGRAAFTSWLSTTPLDRAARPRAVAGVLIGSHSAPVGAGALFH